MIEVISKPEALGLFLFVLVLFGKLIWNMWSESRKEAKYRANKIVENTVDIAVVEERVDGHDKRIGNLEDDAPRPKQTRK
jgi:hypothetical protein